MTVKAQILKIFEHEDVNFLLTNRIPRRLATQFIGWFSRIEQPLVRDLSIAAWRLFADLDLSEAKKEQFNSLHDCFIRELKDGVRPIDQRGQILVSPCDAIVGACGKVAGAEAVPGERVSIRAGGSTLRRRAGRSLSRRLLCDVAAEIEHVSPFPRAA